MFYKFIPKWHRNNFVFESNTRLFSSEQLRLILQKWAWKKRKLTFKLFIEIQFYFFLRRYAVITWVILIATVCQYRDIISRQIWIYIRFYFVFVVWKRLDSGYSIFRFLCMFCRSLLVLLYFFLWPLRFLFFFDCWILVTSLLSSSSSYRAQCQDRASHLTV